MNARPKSREREREREKAETVDVDDIRVNPVTPQESPAVVSTSLLGYGLNGSGK
jgi:hypothetical protein